MTTSLPTSRSMLLRRIGSMLSVMAFCVGAAVAGQPKHGGTLTFLVKSEPSALLPLAQSGAASQVGPKIVEGLLTYDFDLSPKPALATTWSVSPDGLRYTFKLREGVKWHDGEDFTSADVAYSILTLKEVNPRGRAIFANVSEVLTPGPQEAVIVLTQPSPYLITALDSYSSPIVPRHLFAGQDPRANPYNAKPVGTGPFIFKEWVRGSHVILERNTQYWDQPKPWLDRVVVRFQPEAAANTLSLESGEGLLTAGDTVALADLARIEQNPALAIERRGFEYRGELDQLFFNFQNPILQKREVRRAIAHAIDIDTLVNNVFLGYAVPTHVAISAFLTEFHDASIPPYGFDPAKANQLLDQAGYPRDASGKRFKLRLYYNPSLPRKAADVVRQFLQRVGIETELSAFDFATYVRKTYTEREWDLTLEVLGNSFDPVAGVNRLYISRNFKVGLPFSNPGAYANPQVDDVLDAATIETDRQRRVALYRQFQRLVYDDVAAVNLVSPNLVSAYNRRVRNHTISATGTASSFADVYLD